MGHWLDLQPNTRNLNSTVCLITSSWMTLYNSLSFSALWLLCWKMSLLWWKRCLGTCKIQMLEEKWMRQRGSVRSDKPLTCISAYYSLLFLFLSIFSSNKTFYHIQHLPALRVKRSHGRERSTTGLAAHPSPPLQWSPAPLHRCSPQWTAAAWHGLAETVLLHQLSQTHSAGFWYCWGTNRLSFSQPRLLQCHQ